MNHPMIFLASQPRSDVSKQGANTPIALVHQSTLEHIGRHFESCSRIAPTSTMVVFILPKWA